MTLFTNYLREANFLFKQKYLVGLLTVVFSLSVFAVWSGLSESATQTQTIERLLEKDHIDRTNVLAKQKDFGGAAYYSFHLTYDSPSPLAFAAMGQRDIYPWKHRIRMLALEGQIYETDADNPELSFLGRFDFAFLVSVLLPLFVILMLHDLRSSERESGRYDLLITTAGKKQHLWFSRALVLCSALAVAMLTPFIIGAIISGATFASTLMMVLVVLGHLAFWMLLVWLFTGHKRVTQHSSSKVASVLLSVWLVFSVLIPVTSDIAINKLVESPNGGEIVLTQREAVNDAWDLPFSATWQAFLATHPQWQDKTAMNSLFEWKWYYAFQQVGDQKAQPLSSAYRQATLEKDDLANKLALLSPPMMTQRLLSSIAETDTLAAMQYEQRIRDFHMSLRQFYYPLLFNETQFTPETMSELPQFMGSDTAIKK